MFCCGEPRGGCSVSFKIVFSYLGAKQINSNEFLDFYYFFCNWMAAVILFCEFIHPYFDHSFSSNYFHMSYSTVAFYQDNFNRSKILVHLCSYWLAGRKRFRKLSIYVSTLFRLKITKTSECNLGQLIFIPCSIIFI